MKKLISILLVTVTLVSSFCLNAFAQTDSYGSYVTLNYSGLSIGKIALCENAIAISDVSDEYLHLMLVLKDAYGNEVYKEVSHVNNRQAFFKLYNISEGRYEVEVYQSSKRYSTYDSVIWQGLYMYWNTNHSYIETSPVYKHNLSIKQSENITDEALSYFLNPSENIESDDYGIISAAKAITSEYSTTYEKALALHDWVANNIYYNYDAYYSGAYYGNCSAKAVLNSRLTVCEGYSNLFIAFARAIGIPARKVLGLGFDDYETECAGIEDTNHAWAELYVDDRWIITDVTWDSGNKLEGGVFIRKGVISHLYFDISIEGLSLEHKIVKGNIYNQAYLYKDYPEFYINDTWSSYDYPGTAPTLIQDRMYIPLRSVIEALGGCVIWEKDGSFDRITCKLNGHYLQMWIEYSDFYVDNIKYQFEALPKLINGKTMIPLRSVLESLGCDVRWDDYADNWSGRVTIGYIK